MKRIYFYSSLGIILIMLLICCTPKKVHAESNVSAMKEPRAKLASLGFSVLETPQDIMSLTALPLDGSNPFTKKDFRGKVSILNFWASWCPPCRAEMPSLEKCYAATKNTNIRIVAVNAAEPVQDVQKFIAKNKYTFPIYLDEKAAATGIYAARGLPSTYIVNKNGSIIAVHLGDFDFSSNDFIDVLKDLSNE